MRLGRHERHEILLNDIAVLLQRRLHIRIHNALLHERLLDRVVDHLGVILCTDPRERRFLRLGNPQTVERILDVLGHLVPVPNHLRVRAHIGHNIIHIQIGETRPPCGHWRRVIHIQRFQTKLQHPLRIILTRRDVANDLLRQPRLRLIRRAILIRNIVDRPLDVGDLRLFLWREILHPAHPTLSCEARIWAKPSSLIC